MCNRLREYRAGKGLTQAELAQRTQVSRQTIISIERGRFYPSLLVAFLLAAEFNVSVNDIFIFRNESNQKKEDT